MGLLNMYAKGVNRFIDWLRAFYDYSKSDNDFVLRIAPLKKDHEGYKDYFPPPGYGIPPGRNYKNNVTKKLEDINSYEKYGLFLWPGSLYGAFIKQTLWIQFLVPSMFVSYLIAETCIGYLGGGLIYLGIYFFIILMGVFLLNWIFSQSPPVLSSIWSRWPYTQYEKFLSVPHCTVLHVKDRNPDHEPDKNHPYWNPDKPVKYFHESAYFAKGTRTLQEVILHLAIFDFLFNKSSSESNSQVLRFDKEGEKKNKVRIVADDITFGPSGNQLIKSGHWLVYLFSPVLINYILLLFSFFVFAAIMPPFDFAKQGIEGRILFQFPFALALPLFIWLYFSMRRIDEVKNYLRRIHREIEEEYYDGHLDLVPPPILNALENIPKGNHIQEGISEMDKLQQVIQAGALIAFLALLEIFSSAVSS
jgi:hypothetical protein